MKKHFSDLRRAGVWAVFSALLAFSSCTKDETVPSEASGPGKLDKQDVELIGSMGFSTEGLIRRDDYYVVRGGIIITRERLDSVAKSPQTKHQFNLANGFVYPENQMSILINTFNPENQQTNASLKAAMQEWNNISGCKVKFYDGFGVSVMLNPWAGQSVLECDYPLSGKPGTFITVNTQNANSPAPGSSAEKYMFMHALARIIGFMPSPSYGIADGNTIPGTKPFESNSIMVGDEYTATRSGFSASDIAVFKKVYPSAVPYPVVTPEQTGEMYAGTSYRFKAKYDLYSCPKPAYTWKCTGPDGDVAVKATNDAAEVTFGKPGTYKLTANITNFGAGPYWGDYTAVVKPTPDSKPVLSITPAISGVPLLNTRYEVSARYNNPQCPNPVFSIGVTDRAQGHQPQITNKGNGKIDVVFTDIGQYRITASVTNASPVVTTTLDLPAVNSVTDPALTLSVSPAGELLTNRPYEITAQYGKSTVPNPKFRFEVSGGNDAQVTPVGNNKISVIFSKAGNYRVKATVTNATTQPVTSIDLQVARQIVNPVLTITPAITGKPELNRHYEVKAAFDDPECPAPQFEFAVTDLLYGHSAQMTPKGNGTVDVMFTQEGRYRISATVTNAPSHPTATLELPGIYKKYDRVYVKIEECIEDSFMIPGRGTVYTGFAQVAYYADESLTERIPYLDQSLSVRAVKKEYSKGSAEDKILSDKVETIGTGQASYRLPGAINRLMQGDLIIGRQWYEVELLSLGE